MSSKAAFKYVALEASGKRHSGVVEAPDEKSAIAQLKANGRMVTEIASVDQAGAASDVTAGADRERQRAGRADIALFTRRLADLANAGLPLDRAFQVLANQSESQQLAEICDSVLEDLRSGLSVSEGLAKFPKLFSEVYVQTIRAGEEAGQLPESADRLADLLEVEVERRSKIISALIYPAILSATAIFVVVFLLTFVVPRLSVVFEDLGDDLPAPTKMLLATTNFITQNWVALVVGIVIAVVSVRAYFATEPGRKVRDQMLLNLPAFGKITHKAVVSRYSRVLGTLVNGGVSILEALDISALATANAVFVEKGRRVREEVKDGRPVAEALRDVGGFPPVLTHMVAIGEETGELPRMLGRVSDSLDFEVEQGLRRATSLVEPVIILVMGVFVAFVVLSVMLPIIEAQSLIQ